MDLFFAAYWRRLRYARKDALRSGTATDNPDRTCIWLQHSLSTDGEETELVDQLSFGFVFNSSEFSSPEFFLLRALVAD